MRHKLLLALVALLLAAVVLAVTFGSFSCREKSSGTVHTVCSWCGREDDCTRFEVKGKTVYLCPGCYDHLADYYEEE